MRKVKNIQPQQEKHYSYKKRVYYEFAQNPHLSRGIQEVNLERTDNFVELKYTLFFYKNSVFFAEAEYS